MILFIVLDGVLKGFRGDSIRNHPHFLALMISLPFAMVRFFVCELYVCRVCCCRMNVNVKHTAHYEFACVQSTS